MRIILLKDGATMMDHLEWNGLLVGARLVIWPLKDLTHSTALSVDVSV